MDDNSRSTPKRYFRTRKQHKDRLFCDLFSDKHNALSLYNAVKGTDYKDIEHLEVVTLSDSIYMTMKNDLALCFHDGIDLYEQQSSVNPNMPLRGFLYFAREYEGWLAKHQLELKLYGRMLVKIPAPEYYVLYNGMEKMPERTEYRLSDAFEKSSPGYEWTAKVININAGHSPEVLERCPVLKGYAELIALIREYQRNGMQIEAAVSAAVSECIKRGILREYLTKQKSEATNMILTEFDQDAYEEMLKEESRAEGKAEGILEGISRGKADGILEGMQKGKAEGITQSLQAVQLLREGKSVHETALSTGMQEEDVEALAGLL